MADQATIATGILARYAADAAREVEGVRAISGRRGIRISGTTAVRVEIHLVAGRDTSIPALGRRVQARVREYLASMADLEPAAVDVVVDAIE